MTRPLSARPLDQDTRDDISIETSAGVTVAGIASRSVAGLGDLGDAAPLLVCLHGGGSNSLYFDVPGLSFLDVAAANGFVAVSLDRPGYARSGSVAADQRTFASNAEILEDAIATLWEERGGDHPGVVIVAHSIGSAVAVHLAARRPAWPLLGLAVHGFNTISPKSVVEAWHSLPLDSPLEIGEAQRRGIAFGPDLTFAPDAVERSAVASSPAPIEELLEIVGGWPEEAAEVAGRVSVPVQYRLAEYDALWVVDQSRVDDFAALFTGSPHVDASIAPGVGHSIDHHYQGRALHLRQLAFALDCARLRVGE